MAGAAVVSARVVLAVMVGAIGAALGGLLSKALGLQSFWPGVIVAFVVGVSLFLILSERAS